MSRKSEIKKERDFYCNVSVAFCIASMVGILLSPTIPITAGILAVGAGGSLLGLKKIEKLNAEEKKL